MKTKHIFFVILAGLPLFSYAQKEYRQVRKGNKVYEQGKFNDAEVLYRKALEKNPASIAAKYNLGNALYREKNFQEAAGTWGSLTQRNDLSAKDLAEMWHNTGNAYLEAKNYGAAIEAYKNALKLNPLDNDTRYNLSYALLKARQQQDKQQNQQNKQDQQKQDNQQKQNPQQNNEQQSSTQPQQARPQELSKQDAERMLEAMKNAEQKTMEKLKQEKKTIMSGKPVKDW